MTEGGWEAGKRRHIALSNAAAPQYDTIYERSNFATGRYMRYELQVIDRAIALIDENHRGLALDLGCGTGRDALHFYNKFRQVSAYDFSEEMIRIALNKKLRHRAGTIRFLQRDIEVDLLRDIKSETVAFCNSGFGMGSFIHDLPTLLKEVRRVLMPRGVFVASFYNRESLVAQVDTIEWTPSLAARLEPGTNTLAVNFAGDKYDIPVRAYSVREVRALLANYFDVVEITTYPTLSALFPNSLFESEKARTLCKLVDDVLSTSDAISGGPYIISVCRKHGHALAQLEDRGYDRVMSMLRMNNIIPNIKDHGPVSSLEEAATALNAPLSDLIKTILVKVTIETPPRQEGDEIRRPPTPEYFAVALQASLRLDYSKLATLLGVPRKAIDVCAAAELEEITGFGIGGVPPLGYPRAVNVILDHRATSLEYVYCGSGKRTESLRLAMSDLKHLACPVVADISKE